MTAQAGDLLVEQIAPRLRTLVPKSVKPVGAEDTEELVQDAIVIAAQMLHPEARKSQFLPQWCCLAQKPRPLLSFTQ